MKYGQKSPLFHQQPYLWCSPCHSQNLRLFPEHIRPVHSLYTQGRDKEYTCFSSGSANASPWPMLGGACASNVLLCGDSCAWCRFFHWCLGEPLACPALQTHFSARGGSYSTHCSTSISLLLTTEAFPQGCVAACSLPHAGVRARCCCLVPWQGGRLPGAAFGRKWGTLFVLIWSEAAAGRKADSTNMEPSKQ